MALTVLPLHSEKMGKNFDVFEELLKVLEKNDTKLEDGDILVISTKYISNSQGRILDLEKTKISQQSLEISKKYRIRKEIAEIINRESDIIFGGIAGFVITSAKNIMAPNAGIDKSNAKKGKIILYPNQPFLVSEQIRRKIFLKFFIHVGIILVDSRLMPARIGTSGITIACSGIEPVSDLRSKKGLRRESIKSNFSSGSRQYCNGCQLQDGRRWRIKPFCNCKKFRSKIDR